MEANVTPAVCLIRCCMMDHGQVLVVPGGHAYAEGTEDEGDEANHEEVFNGIAYFHVIIIGDLGGKLKPLHPRRSACNRGS